MKPENKFRTWFIKELEEYVTGNGAKFRAAKHADYARGGVLDMDFAIHGITGWMEFKLIPTIMRERKLDVTPIQQAEINALTVAGVYACVIVGLPLGPRQGYKVALFDCGKIPDTVSPDDFIRAKEVCSFLWLAMHQHTNNAHERFNT